MDSVSYSSSFINLLLILGRRGNEGLGEEGTGGGSLNILGFRTTLTEERDFSGNSYSDSSSSSCSSGVIVTSPMKGGGPATGGGGAFLLGISFLFCLFGGGGAGRTGRFIR